jgi:hypothetical protein
MLIVCPVSRRLGLAAYTSIRSNRYPRASRCPRRFDTFCDACVAAAPTNISHGFSLNIFIGEHAKSVFALRPLTDTKVLWTLASEAVQPQRIGRLLHRSYHNESGPDS